MLIRPLGNIMAIITGGINGGFIGKAGSVVGYCQHGKWVMRGLPRLSPKNKKGSVDQNICRSKFSKMQYFLGPILAFIRTGFNLEAKRKGNTAHNSAKSWNMLNAFDENGEINYSAVRVSSGNLPGAADVAVETNGDELVFSWRDNSNEVPNPDHAGLREIDQVMLLAYNPQFNVIRFVMSGARRSAGREVLDIGWSKPGLEVHTWISFIADDRQSIANSTYAGMVVF